MGIGAVYLHYPDGMARSKLTLGVLEKLTGVACTVRNLNTAENMVALLAARGCE